MDAVKFSWTINFLTLICLLDNIPTNTSLHQTLGRGPKDAFFRTLSKTVGVRGSKVKGPELLSEKAMSSLYGILDHSKHTIS